MGFKVLAQFLGVESMQKEAWTEAKAVTERHDVPQGERVPADLRDVQGRFHTTREGFRITGRLLARDMLEGSSSPALPLVLASYTVLYLLIAVGGGLGLVGPKSAGVLSFAWLAMVATMIEREEGLLGILSLGFLAVGLSSGQSPFMAFAGAFAAMTGILVFQVFETITGIILGKIPYFLMALVMCSVMTGGGAVQALPFGPLLGFMGPSSSGSGFGQFLAALIPGLLPLMWWRGRRLGRAAELAAQGTKCTLESMGALSTAHEAARREQAKNAVMDPNKFVRVGIATGAATQKWDGYAPDQGLVMGLTAGGAKGKDDRMAPSDLATHLFVFGSSGTGKTSRALLPLAWQCAQTDIGMFVLDGKGQLPSDLAGLPNYEVLEPGKGRDVALLEGLAPEGVQLAVLALQSMKGENGQFWNSTGGTHLLNSSVILRTLVDWDLGSLEQRRKDNPEEPRWYLWSLSELYKLMNDDLSSEEAADRLTSFIVEVAPPSLGKGGPLDQAMAYFKAGGQLWKMDEKLRSNVVGTVNSWLAPALDNPVLRKWCDLETGVPVEEVLIGARYGFNLPEFIYGEAGKLVSSLVKGRVYNALKKRSVNWFELGGKPVLLMVDECQNILGDADLALAPVARSLGGMIVYATQTIEGIVAKVGEPATLALLDNFASTIAFRCSDGTQKWLSSKLGSCQTVVFKQGYMAVDYNGTASMAMTSPLRDPAHPNASDMRGFMQRMRAGRTGGVNKFGDSRMTGVQLRTPDDAGLAIATEIMPSTSAEFVNGPLFRPEELDSWLVNPGYALIQVMRGGVRRRDVAQCLRKDEWERYDAREAAQA